MSKIRRSILNKPNQRSDRPVQEHSVNLPLKKGIPLQPFKISARELQALLDLKQAIKMYLSELKESFPVRGDDLCWESEDQMVGILLTYTWENEHITSILLLEPVKLMTLPESFGTFQHLKQLEIFCNHLISLPSSFGNLQALHTLKLRCNHLTVLPESFGNLQALQSVDLHCAQLTSLPESFGNLRALETLQIRRSSLTHLPESFGNLQALESLELASSTLDTLPDSFKNLRSLQKLKLSMPEVKNFPPAFWKLDFLQVSDSKGWSYTTCHFSL